MAKAKKQRKLKNGEWVTKGGTIVTPEIEERWSNEFEDGFDLCPGKPLGGNKKQKKCLEIELDLSRQKRRRL